MTTPALTYVYEPLGLRAFCEAQHMTVADLAGILGVHEATANRYLAATEAPRFDDLLKLCTQKGVPPERMVKFIVRTVVTP